MLKKQTEFVKCSLNQSRENCPSNCACNLAEREGDHVTTFKFLFEFQNRIFLKFLFKFQVVRTSNRLKFEGPLYMAKD